MTRPPFGGSRNPAEIRDFRKAVFTSLAKQATCNERRGQILQSL